MEDQSCILQTHTALLGGRTVAVEEATPRLDPQEYDRRLRAIGHDLYEILIQDKAAGA